MVWSTTMYFNTIVRHWPIRKIFSKYFDYIQTTIKTLIIFLTQYFQGKNYPWESPFFPKASSLKKLFKW
jgi:hypothetical protein